MKKENNLIFEAYRASRKPVTLKESTSWSIQDSTVVKWFPRPENPDGVLIDTDSGAKFSKAEFWASDINGRDPADTIPAYGAFNGTWTFEWDTGVISGFVEGEDFVFVNKGI